MHKRELSLEVQLYTYISYHQETPFTAREVKLAFFGLASFNSINSVLAKSPLFTEDQGLFKVTDAGHRANLKYDFMTTGNPANIELWIDGKPRAVRVNVSLSGVGLYGIHYQLPVEVRIIGGPPASWNLDVKEIFVTGPDFKHHRRLHENPLTGSGSYRRHQPTYLKD